MSVLRSGIVVSLFTFLSKVSGLVREQTIAFVFGSGAVADCINVALKFPNLFRRILGEGALSSVFIPIYSQKIQLSEGVARIFANKIFTLLVYISIFLTVVMQIFAPQVLLLIAPGFYGLDSKFELCVLMCRITMPYLIFITLSALLGGMLNAKRHFWVFAISPVIFNIVIISASLMDISVQNPVIVGWGILAAGILQYLFMSYRAKKYNIKCNFTAHILSYDSMFLLRQMIPAIMSFGVTQISIFISLSLASFIEGAISILSYAERIYQLPLALIGVAFSTLLLPELAKLYNARDLKKAAAVLEKSVKLGLTIAIPASLGLGCIADFITCILYQRGAFSPADTNLTAQCLLILCIGLPASILNKILTPAFYADSDVKTPFKITFYSVIANIILNLIFMQLYGILGIALASSCSAWFNTFMLLYLSYKKKYLPMTKGLGYFLIKLGLLNLSILILILFFKHLVIIYFYQNNFLIKIGILAGIVAGSILAYIALSFSSSLISFKELKEVGKRKL